MNRRATFAVIAVVIVVVVGVVTLLATGGPEPPPRSDDSRGDVVLTQGPTRPDQPELADIVAAEVRREGDEFIFEARLAAAPPKRISGGELELRWSIYQATQEMWRVSASLALEPTAFVVSQASGFSLSTFLKNLPGDIEVEGSTVTIRIKPAKIEGFPTRFPWTLETSLDADRGDPESSRAEDRAPDEGLARFSGFETPQN